jgi:hypothetical protein
MSLTVWVIYDHPRDYPEKWVVRGQTVEGHGKITPSPDCSLHDSLVEARRAIPPGLVMLSRDPGDDPVIRETWL